MATKTNPNEDLHELAKGWKAAIARTKDPATKYDFLLCVFFCHVILFVLLLNERVLSSLLFLSSSSSFLLSILYPIP